MSNPDIYLDYQATTPLDPRVLERMMPYLTTKFGNPHSTNHSFGWEAAAGVDVARPQVAQLIGADEREIIFTSGATEANNMAIKGIAYAQYPAKNHIITAQTEHTCVLESCRALERSGFQVTYLPVDNQGLIDLNELRDSITDKTALVSIMAVNNEIGMIQDIAAIGAICRNAAVVFHTDAAQAVGKIPLDVTAMNIDLISISGHKIYGPKGIGALYVNEECPVRPLALFDGGGQERGLRSGTLSPALCVGLGSACVLAEQDMTQDAAHISMLAHRLKDKLQSALPDIQINGSEQLRYAGNLNITFDHVKADQLVKELRGIAVSAGSACSTEKVEPSHVLTALGLSKKQIDSSIRIGIGRMTTEPEIDQAARHIILTVQKIRNLM
ncbi:cysteine desulfurase family protein [Paremcibacter congregatus]|uniref:Cysteine desulfurase n=1 Tax=Paremcibacter congregatus TaxID=2043170 RepID=A0A2G4YMS6_9PROT|nr:aminotransferase class V-fold PLP-dependent enzyme [Paremcibacter congregatus]PHZ83605.1 IscS subfamily cysteine desulfurase [Paremcibacter congregatus]QDE27305.1 aminotransferase class V-fold PLP-dependent enzyme [Paremcibacter congregatus]